MLNTNINDHEFYLNMQLIISNMEHSEDVTAICIAFTSDYLSKETIKIDN